MAGAGAWQQPRLYRVKTPILGSVGGRVQLAVKAIQTELNHQGQDPGALDGLFGKNTENAVKSFQQAQQLTADGILGPSTSRALFSPMAKWWEAELGIPQRLLCGMLQHESSFDPGAQGWYDERDRGLAQINSRWHPSVTDELAYNNRYAIQWAAGRLRGAFDELGYWAPAIAYHNNPAKARKWVRDFKPPDDQINDYVNSVKKAARLFY